MSKAAMQFRVLLRLAASDRRLITVRGALLMLLIEVDQVAHRTFRLSPLFAFR